MPKANIGAKIIAKDKRENMESRRIKLKLEGDTIVNENELLRTRSLRKKRSRNLGMILLSNKMHVSQKQETANEEELTVTQKMYEDLKKHEDHLLSLQPRYYDYESDPSEGDGDEMS